jgi:hypothetical protein
MVQSQFGLKPKRQAFSYKWPYPEWYDQVLPTNYRLLEFTKFTGQDSTNTIEHVSRYLNQLGEVSLEEAAIEFGSLLCPCQDQPSPDFYHWQSILLPIGTTLRRSSIHISIPRQEKGRSQIYKSKGLMNQVLSSFRGSEKQETYAFHRIWRMINLLQWLFKECC